MADESLKNKTPAVTADAPVFGFILLGGPISGALIRDMRLANELARRGFRVHVWWAMDRSGTLELDDRITQHWLFHGLRYLRLESWWDGKFPEIRDRAGQMLTRLFRDSRREHYLQKRPRVLRGTVQGLLCQVRDGVERDTKLIRRFARELEQAKVTHVLPMLVALCPFIQAAREHVSYRVEYLVTFQGYELYVNYARMLGFEQAIYERFVETVKASGRQAIGVSEDYCQRVVEDVGLEAKLIHAVPPGVPGVPGVPAPGTAPGVSSEDAGARRAAALDAMEAHWGKEGYRRDVPTFTFVGRRDTEKGLDLLLYAAAMVRKRGLAVQVVIAGPTLFGKQCLTVLLEIAENLRLPVFWTGRVSDEFRSHLFAGSRAVVYPSIHREPFGMVPVEAIAHGTPAIVPNYGGVKNTIEAEGKVAGLRFDVWDSGSLAKAMETLITDQAKWEALATNGPAVAEYYSVGRLAARVLGCLGVRMLDVEGRMSNVN